jgi:hypothetical protein
VKRVSETPEWIRFRVGEKSKAPNWVNIDCQPVDTIFHITHVGSAIQVLSGTTIKAGLVFDKSRLNSDRILVVWLSPNDWSGAGGFRYGNVRFSFDLRTLIHGKRFYWVESIAYSIPAARILVTEKDYDGVLMSYDPSRGDGPWWYDKSDNRHYWNGKYCLEIMHEGDLPIGNVSRVDLVGHHPNRCSIAPNTCPDRGLSKKPASGIFLAEIVARRLDPSPLKWVTDNEISDDLIEAWQQIRADLLKLYDPTHFGKMTLAVKKASIALGRATLAAYSRGDKTEVVALLGLMPWKAIIRACAMAIANDFGISISKLRST